MEAASFANNSTYDASARMLAKEVGAVVVSLEYSKAPLPTKAGEPAAAMAGQG